MNPQFIESIAQNIWGEANATTCVTQFPFLPLSCIQPLLIKALGLFVIVASCLNKAPLFINILKNKSVAGMSPQAVYSESIMYANAAFYSIRRGNPFTAYGEVALITAQSLIVICFMWIYREPQVSMKEKSLYLLFWACYLHVVFNVLDKDQLYILMSLNLPVTCFSRGSQIAAFLKVKHTGTQSIVTVMMNFMGSMIRVVTTIHEVGLDLPMLTGYGLSLALNGMQIALFLKYKENTKRYLQSLQHKKKE
jgi:mannose-P-dolichol utilization defect protein 1